MNPNTLILASRSSRRAKLLRDAGYRFVQVLPPFEDPPQPNPRRGTNPESLAMNLALAKARSTFTINYLHLNSTSLILAADTIVVSGDGTLIGQPLHRNEAEQMLGTLINVTHCVYTGVAVLDHRGRHEMFADGARVHLGNVDQSHLTAYLESGQWQGKAGGYNLFDPQPRWPWTVTGDPTTVVGLPMKKLTTHLGRHLDSYREAPSATDTPTDRI